jgi:hypothetical protein
MLLNGIYERQTVSTTTTKSSNGAVFTLVPVLPLIFTASNGNTQQAATFYIWSYNNEQLTGTFSERCNSNQKVPRCSFAKDFMFRVSQVFGRIVKVRIQECTSPRLSIIPAEYHMISKET